MQNKNLCAGDVGLWETVIKKGPSPPRRTAVLGLMALPNGDRPNSTATVNYAEEGPKMSTVNFRRRRCQRTDE